MGASLAASVGVEDGIVYSMKAYEDLAVSICRKQGNYNRVLKEMREALENNRAKSRDDSGDSNEKSTLFRPIQWVKKFSKGIKATITTQRTRKSSKYKPFHVVA